MEVDCAVLACRAGKVVLITRPVRPRHCPCGKIDGPSVVGVWRHVDDPVGRDLAREVPGGSEGLAESKRRSARLSPSSSALESARLKRRGDRSCRCNVRRTDAGRSPGSTAISSEVSLGPSARTLVWIVTVRDEGSWGQNWQGSCTSRTSPVPASKVAAMKYQVRSCKRAPALTRATRPVPSASQSPSAPSSMTRAKPAGPAFAHFATSPCTPLPGVVGKIQAWIVNPPVSRSEGPSPTMM